MRTSISTREMWTERIAQFESSDLSLKEWCATKGVKEHQYYYWRKQLNKSQAETCTFISLDGPPFKPSHNNPGMSITYKDMSVYVETDFDESTLTKILKVMKSL